MVRMLGPMSKPSLSTEYFMKFRNTFFAVFIVGLAGSPIAFDGMLRVDPAPAPTLGADTEPLLAELGLTASEIGTLLDTGEDGANASWENPNGTASGAMEVLDRSEDQGRACRRTCPGSRSPGPRIGTCSPATRMTCAAIFPDSTTCSSSTTWRASRRIPRIGGF